MSAPLRPRGFGVVIVGLAVFAGGLAAWWFWPRSDPSAALNEFVRLVATNQLDEAYALTSRRLRGSLDPEELGLALESFDELRAASGVVWSKTARERYEGVREDRWEQCVRLAGHEAFVAARLLREEDVWRVDALAVGERELDADAAIGFACRRSRTR
ncbi:MAG: hypothetical protein KC586_09920 [Myxococcales bacterium]|nr:hypothetical protein [Myxococcales bacterium]